MTSGRAIAVIGAAAIAASYVYKDELGRGVDFVRDWIKAQEGFSSTPYVDDDAKTPQVERSVGYGHQLTGAETTSDPEQLLSKDIAAAEAAVARLVRVPLSANQRAALISFVYNVGAGAFASSTMLRRLNAGDYAGAAAEFDRWIYAGGKVSSALQARRARERQLFTA